METQAVHPEGSLAAHPVESQVVGNPVAYRVGIGSWAVARAEIVVRRCRVEEGGSQAARHAVREGRRGAAAVVEGA